MKRLSIIFLALALTVSIAAAAFAVAMPDAPKEKVEMKFPGEKNKFAPIMFEHHDRHLAIEGSCVSCHHKWDGKSDITGCRVEGCHVDFSKANKKQPTSYDSGFHFRKSTKSCVGCHTATIKANKASVAPKKCNDCHTKK